MNQIRPTPCLNRLKRFFSNFAVIFFFTFVQFYWAMGSFSDKISSACLSCWFVEDVVVMSLFTGIWMSVIFFLTSKIKEGYITKSLNFYSLVIFWFYWNYTIFVDRESSWSTYDFASEMQYTFLKSMFPAVLLATFTIIYLSKFDDREILFNNKF